MRGFRVEPQLATMASALEWPIELTRAAHQLPRWKLFEHVNEVDPDSCVGVTLNRDPWAWWQERAVGMTDDELGKLLSTMTTKSREALTLERDRMEEVGLEMGAFNLELMRKAKEWLHLYRMGRAQGIEFVPGYEFTKDGDSLESMRLLMNYMECGVCLGEAALVHNAPDFVAARWVHRRRCQTQQVHTECHCHGRVGR